MLDGGRLVESSSWGGFGAGRLAGEVGSRWGDMADGGAPSAVVVVRSETGRLDCGLQSASPGIVQTPGCLDLLIQGGCAGWVVKAGHTKPQPETLVGLEPLVPVPAALALPGELSRQPVPVPRGQAVVRGQAVHLHKS